MKQKWGREDDAGGLSERPGGMEYRGRSGVALLSVFAIAGLSLHARVDTAQRHYLLTYAGTPVAGAFRTDAPYTLLMVVTRKGARLALDNK